MTRRSDLDWLAAELRTIHRQLQPIEESPDLVLALDQGSHATKAVLFDSAGRDVAEAHVPVPTARPAQDRVEQDADELLQSILQAAHDALSSEPVRGRRVAAAGLATQRSTIVCFDRSDGKALSPAISWQDRRGLALVEKLAPLRARIRRQTGLVLSPHYGASKMRWCLDELPEVRAALRQRRLCIGPLSTYLLHWLLVERPIVTDPANASRTLLFDPLERKWSPVLLDAFSVPVSVLPRCVPTSYAYGRLQIDGRDIPLVVCTGDQSAAAFAFGTPRPDTAYVNIGTGAFVQCAVSPKAKTPEGLLRSILYSDSSATVASIEGTVNGAAGALEWFREHAEIDPERALKSLPAAAPDDLPIFLNGVGGLGSPYWRPSAPIEFVGNGDDRERLMAVLESIAFLLDANLRAMASVVSIQRIEVTGGLARSDYLCQVLADVSGFRVERAAVREATTRGAAFLAAGQPGNWLAPEVERTFTPVRRQRLATRQRRWRKVLEERLREA